MRLLQLTGPDGRRAGMVDGEQIRLLATHGSVHALATAALATSTKMAEAAQQDLSGETLDYPEICAGTSAVEPKG